MFRFDVQNIGSFSGLEMQEYQESENQLRLSYSLSSWRQMKIHLESLTCFCVIKKEKNGCEDLGTQKTYFKVLVVLTIHHSFDQYFIFLDGILVLLSVALSHKIIDQHTILSSLFYGSSIVLVLLYLVMNGREAFS